MNERIHVTGPTYADTTLRLNETICLDGSARIEEERTDLGGTGLCYSLALGRLGNNVTLHSRIGTDEKAEFVYEQVARESNIEFVWQVEKGSSTDHCYTIIDPSGTRSCLGYKQISHRWEVQDDFADRVGNAEAMVITSFSNKIASNILQRTGEQCARKPPIMWAPHRANCEEAKILVENLDMVDHITLSKEEYAALYKSIGNPIEHGVNSITVTNGKNGCELITASGERHFEPIELVENPYDTNGAGEAFGSAFLTVFLKSGNYDQAVKGGQSFAYLHLFRPASDFPTISQDELMQMARGTLSPHQINPK